MVQLDVKRDHVLEVYGFVERNLSHLITKPIIAMVPVDYAHHPSKFATLQTVRDLAREGCPLDNVGLMGRWCEQVKLSCMSSSFDAFSQFIFLKNNHNPLSPSIIIIIHHMW